MLRGRGAVNGSRPAWLARAGRLLRCAALLVPLAGLAELGAHFYFAGRAPRFDEWTGLVAPVDRIARPGDLVVVAPRWAEPLARRALGDGRMPLAEIARPDDSRLDAALEISILGARDPELALWPEIERAAAGPFLLRRLRNPQPARLRFDFVEGLTPDRVEVDLAGERCPFNPRARVLSGGLGGHPTFPPARFECSAGEYFNVGVTVIADELFRARRCLWAHPPRRGELHIRFRGVDLGRVIRGHGGMYWMIERERTGAPVELVVRVGGETVGRYVHRDGDGWQSFELPLGRHEGARGAEVEFAVSSSDYRHRHFCFEAVSE
ncbi:MAG: hypothetical protein HY744_12565 [Deltaproteobacteria bacterium]|nr:hypothetical protein [Deltaproteobacteria bacterium]